MMSLLKTFLGKIWQVLLGLIRVLRKAICCRRKKETEYLLPLTIGDVINKEQISANEFEGAEYKSQWEAWPESNSGASLTNESPCINPEMGSQSSQTVEVVEDDFFKDMVPQIRKPKKIYIKSAMKEPEVTISSNRLALDPKAISMDPDLGVIDDGPSSWEDSENLGELWDPDLLIRETKRAEQEKRRAEHQRRKLEMESRRSSKPESLSSMMQSLLDSSTKHS